ncbi:MAG: HPF/RaiA family ribosome-associated protein [bacterium]|nr:HPF/RaiA family ribosome-associated protein [bacterium]
MNVVYSFKNLSVSEKAFCQNYFDGKLPRVQKIIDRQYPEICLDLRAEKFVKKAAYNVALTLMGSPKIFVSEDDHTLNEAIDLALDKLVERLRKLQDTRKSKR